MQVPKRKPGQYTNVKPDPMITRAKFIELVNDLERLKKQRPQAAAEVKRTAANGDFSENVEYQLAKGRLRGMNDRMDQLQYQIDHANIIEENSGTDAVEIGHTVTVSNSTGEKKYKILGSTETNPQAGIISYTSPIGAALMGHSVGDKIEIKIGEKEIKFTIVKIEQL